MNIAEAIGVSLAVATVLYFVGHIVGCIVYNPYVCLGKGPRKEFF